MGRAAHCSFEVTQRHFQVGKGGRVKVTAGSLPRRGRTLGAGYSAAVGASLTQDLAACARAVVHVESASNGNAPDALNFDAVARSFGARLDGPGTEAEVDACRARAARLEAACGEFSTATALAVASDLLVVCAIERPWRPRAAQPSAHRSCGGERRARLSSHGRASTAARRSRLSSQRPPTR